MRNYLLSCILIAISMQINAQKLPVKYVELSDNEKELQKYQDANAVVLCDYGTYYFNGTDNQIYLNFSRHLRIKILSEEGVKYAQQSINFYDLALASTFNKLPYSIKAQTLTPIEKGKWSKSRIKTKDILVSEADVDFNRTLTIKFPDVKVGSIIEYEIIIPTIEVVNPAPWYFDSEIPVLHSEIRFRTSRSFNYSYKLYNTEAPVIENTTQNYSIIAYNGPGQRYLETLHQISKQNIPATNQDIDKKDRAYVKFMLNFADRKFPFNNMYDILKGIDPTFKYKTRSEKNSTPNVVPYILYSAPTLNTIAEDLNKSDEFGIPLITDMGLTDTIKNITAEISNDEERMFSILHHVNDKMVWNNQYRIFVRKGISLVEIKATKDFPDKEKIANLSLYYPYHLGEGSNSEINFILINLLRKAGFMANPVLVSSKDFSNLDKTFYNLHQFNHIIAHVKIKDKVYLLDAVLTNGKPLIESIDFNEDGLLIKPLDCEWIKINNRDEAR